ncbi:hypothetical protein C8Q70DRAFT_518933 [Cubamyces menziesii]|nr:hypothetical protein C8Q70DRAFT_518933 [Cubamyces menziesii]
MSQVNACCAGYDLDVQRSLRAVQWSILYKLRGASQASLSSEATRESPPCTGTEAPSTPSTERFPNERLTALQLRWCFQFSNTRPS